MSKNISTALLLCTLTVSCSNLTRRSNNESNNQTNPIDFSQPAEQVDLNETNSESKPTIPTPAESPDKTPGPTNDLAQSSDIQPSADSSCQPRLTPGVKGIIENKEMFIEKATGERVKLPKAIPLAVECGINRDVISFVSITEDTSVNFNISVYDPKTAMLKYTKSYQIEKIPGLNKYFLPYVRFVSDMTLEDKAFFVLAGSNLPAICQGSSTSIESCSITLVLKDGTEYRDLLAPTSSATIGKNAIEGATFGNGTVIRYATLTKCAFDSYGHTTCSDSKFASSEYGRPYCDIDLGGNEDKVKGFGTIEMGAMTVFSFKDGKRKYFWTGDCTEWHDRNLYK
jgi:hypothetical protein